MRADYPNWLEEQKYSEGTQIAQIHRVKKVEESPCAGFLLHTILISVLKLLLV